MKIKSINVTSFGKFKNYQLNFSDGFNLIYGENENGKTTLMDFIRMMFYGSKNANKAGYINPRKRYAPWDSSAMSGSIDFEHEGKNYRLERQFRGRNSSDKITLLDLDNGTLTDISGEVAPGESFFGLTLSAFEKSVFIDNNVTFHDTEGSGEINSRLANIESSGDETVSSADVIKRVQDAMYELRSATNRGGKIIKDEQSLQLLEDELAEARRIDRLRAQKAEQIADKELAIAEIFKIKSDIFNEIKRSEQDTKYLRLKQFVETANEYEACEKRLLLSDGSVADKIYCDTLRNKITELKIKQTSLDNKRQESDRLLEEIALLEKSAGGDTEKLLADSQSRKEQLNNKLLENQELLNKIHTRKLEIETQLTTKKRTPNIPLIIIGALLTVVFLVVSFIVGLYLLPFAAVGIILLALGLFSKTNPDYVPLNEELDQLKQSLATAEKNKESITQSLETANEQHNLLLVSKNTDQNLIVSKREYATRIMTEVSRLQLETNDMLCDILAFCARLKPATDVTAAAALLDETENDIVLLENLRTKAEYAAKGTGCHNLTEATEHLAILEKTHSGTGAQDTEQLKLRLDEITKEHAKLNQDLATLKAEAATEYANIKSPSQIENEIAELKKKIGEKEDYHEILSLAAAALNDADAVRRRSFSSVLDGRALQIFKEITAQKYDSLMVSKDFDISVSGVDSLGTQSLAGLSRGANDQAYFALRLALAEIIGKESGGLPLLLDDVFSQYDDKRQETAFNFLKTYSKDNQLLFFTCHNNCKEAANKLGAKVISL